MCEAQQRAFYKFLLLLAFQNVKICAKTLIFQLDNNAFIDIRSY